MWKYTFMKVYFLKLATVNNIEPRLLQIVMQNQNVLFQEAIQILEIRSNMCENARQSTSVHQF